MGFNMKKEYVDFACALHGYCIRVKEIHWATDINSQHLLCDEVEETIHDCEDRFMECAMGMEGKKFQIGKLLPMLPNAKNLSDMLDELVQDILEMKEKLNGKKDGGLFNVLDDLHELCNKYKYRATQK